MVRVLCRQTRAPRMRGGHVSAWYVGMELQLKPLPRPVTIRPTRSCASVVDEPSKAAM